MKLGNLQAQGCLQHLLSSFHELIISFLCNSSKAQLFLNRSLKSLFPHETDIEFNYTLQLVPYSRSESFMQADAWIPHLGLIFEYQGRQHYLPNYFNDYKVQITKDKEKKKICQEVGLTLIQIPFWWDYTVPSLAATVKKVKPITYLF